MISDEERREIAAQLANEAQTWRGTFPDEACDLGDVSALMQDLCHFAGLRGKVSCGDIFQRFADLIDRPTCHNASGHQDMCAQKPKARKRAIYLVTDFGGDWEDAWERPVIAFTDKARAEECAAKRETRQYDEYGPIWDYEGSEVKEIPLVDFGDRQEEASRYAESACAGL